MNLARSFLTFSLLLLVLAIGFVVGRVMVARTYAEAGPKLEKRPAGEPEVAAEMPQERPLFPGSVYVPPPAPPEAPPEEIPEEGLEAGTAAGEGVAEPGEVREAPRAQAETPQVQEPQAQAPGAVSEAEREAEPKGGSVPPVRPAEAREPDATRYSIQIGVFTVREGARQVAEELTRAGYPARIDVTSPGEQTLYRVLTGRYHTEYAARKALAELQREGFSGFLVRR